MFYNWKGDKMSPSGRGPLRIAIEDWLDGFDLGAIFSKWIEKVLDNLEDSNMKVYRSLLVLFDLTGKLPPGMDPDRLELVVKSSQSGFFLSLFGILGVAAGGFFGGMQPFQRLMSYYVDSFYRT